MTLKSELLSIDSSLQKPSFLKTFSLRKIIFISLVVGVINSSILSLGFFSSVQLKINDLFFILSCKIKTLPSQIKEITLISVDDSSLKKINKRWPWPRDVELVYLKNLMKYNPKVTCLDFVFSGEATPQEDLLLSSSLRQTKNVLLSSSYISPS